MKRSTSMPPVTLVAAGVVLIALGAFGATRLMRASANDALNQPAVYPVHRGGTLHALVDIDTVLGTVDRHLFGTNLEWFNEAGGLASPDPALRERLAQLTVEQGVTVLRWPGGTLADFYHWKDGTGPAVQRPTVKHPTDVGSSTNVFGTPEYFALLDRTGSEGLVTVNAGTAMADEAAAWVAYANQPDNALRAADGHPQPMPIRYWEIGNELYLPGNPGEPVITVTPQQYVSRYLDFTRAMKAVDPTIRTMAIGVAKAHVGPETAYPEWTEVLLDGAADAIDLIAVHNAYFPLLDGRGDESVTTVYPALWASPEAVDRSLTTLERLIDRHPRAKPIGIAITEWGALFSLPDLDRTWFDHVKTLGSGVYVARMLQVFMSHPRVEFANYFKLTDRSFMGWINYEGTPKVPFRVLELFARASGDQRVKATIDSPTYNAQAVGGVAAESGVADVTVLATRDSKTGRVFVNLVNRSMTTAYPIALDLGRAGTPSQATQMTIDGPEPTAHNGRDIPPEWPYDVSMEPYTSRVGSPIDIVTRPWDPTQPVALQPFSIVTLVMDP